MVRAAFNCWRDAGIPFAVLRNYDALPDSTTNDIDVLVPPTELARAETLLITAARQCGFKLHSRAEFASLALYFSTPDGEQVHFDLFFALRWHSFEFMDWRMVLRDVRQFRSAAVDGVVFPVAHPAHEASSNLFAGLLYDGRIKPKYKSGIAQAFSAHPKEAQDALAWTLGPELALLLWDACSRGDWERAESISGQARRKLIIGQVKHQPSSTMAALLYDAKRLANRLLNPPGLWVILCGSDGSGKSTVVPLVQEALQPTFSSSKGAHYHWKPPVFSQGRRAARGPETNPHAKEPRGVLASLFFFAVHWLEFWLGLLLRVRPAVFRGGLVIIDRWYYDFFIDQKRYRLQVPMSLVRCGYALLPKPDLVILLDAPPEVLHQRKQELPVPELARQRAAFQQMLTRVRHKLVVDVSLPATEVAHQIVIALLERSAEKASRSHGNPFN